MEKDKEDKLPEDYHDLTPEHYGKMVVSKVLHSRWDLSKNESCEYLVHYIRADKFVCEKIYTLTAMEHMCEHAVSCLLNNNLEVAGLITSFVQAHLKFERQVENHRQEVLKTWEAVQYMAKSVVDVAGRGQTFVNPPSGKALALCRERLSLAQENLVRRLGFRPGSAPGGVISEEVGKKTGKECRKKRCSTLIEGVTTTKPSATTVRNESRRNESPTKSPHG